MNDSDSTTIRYLAHKIRLYKLTRQQLAYFHRACGTARWAYNRCVKEYGWDADSGKAPTHFSALKWVSQQKQNDPELQWLYDVGVWVVNGACEAYANSCRRYADRRGYWQSMQEKKGKPNLGKPKTKKKFRSTWSFRAAYSKSCKIELAGRKNQRSRIWIPKLGWVRGREPLRWDGELVETRITRNSSGRWYAVILVKVSCETSPERKNQADGGVDMGLKTLAVDSDGCHYDSPKAQYRKLQTRKRRWERKMSRRRRPRGQQPSSGYLKAKARVARLSQRMADLRSTTTHRVSHALVHKYTRLAIEDLNVKGMMASGGNRKRGLNRGIAEASLATLRNQLEYKGELYGCEVVVVDRWFASSQICSYCGLKKDDLKLSERTITCESCGITYDRDHNAAINLKKELGRITSEVTPVECDTSLPVQHGGQDTQRSRNRKRGGDQPVQLSLL